MNTSNLSLQSEGLRPAVCYSKDGYITGRVGEVRAWSPVNRKNRLHKITLVSLLGRSHGFAYDFLTEPSERLQRKTKSLSCQVTDLYVLHKSEVCYSHSNTLKGTKCSIFNICILLSDCSIFCFV